MGGTRDIQPETMDDIEYIAENSSDGCGCEHRGELWFLCQYHEGYDAAFAETVLGWSPKCP